MLNGDKKKRKQNKEDFMQNKEGHTMSNGKPELEKSGQCSLTDKLDKWTFNVEI